MKGLRTQEDAKFERFFALIQEFAEKQGAVFFLDNGDGRDLILDDMEGEDLSGWLIPLSKADEFERTWKENEIIGDEWDEFFVFAVWKNNGGLKVDFQKY